MPKNSFALKPTDIIILAAVVWVGAATYFIALPQAKRLQANTTTLKTKEAEAEQLERRVETLTILKDQIAEHQEDVKNLAIAYPSEEQQVEALIQAQTMAEHAGLAISDLTPSKGHTGIMPMALNLRGSYQAINTMLKEFYNNVRPAIVRSFTATAGTDKSKSDVSGSFNVGFAYNETAATLATSPSPTAQ
jgi:Tfp pilus assembly protein PilO